PNERRNSLRRESCIPECGGHLTVPADNPGAITFVPENRRFVTQCTKVAVGIPNGLAPHEVDIGYGFGHAIPALRHNQCFYFRYIMIYSYTMVWLRQKLDIDVGLVNCKRRLV